LAPRLGAMLHGTKLRHVDSRGATSDASWRQDTWRHDVVAWRPGPWRQDEGPFFEIFPSGAYLRESFKKRAKKTKKAHYKRACGIKSAWFCTGTDDVE
jgi:hypothetical protein